MQTSLLKKENKDSDVTVASFNGGALELGQLCSKEVPPNKTK